MAISESLSKQIQDIENSIKSGADLKPEDVLSLISDFKIELKGNEDAYNAVSDKMAYYQAQVQQQYGIIDALSGEFSAIYVVPCDNTNIVIPIKKQEHPEESGHFVDDRWGFPEMMDRFVEANVHPDDQEGVRKALDFKHLCKVIAKSGLFYYHFRTIKDDVVHYYYLKASKVGSITRFDAVMVGFVCEDESKEREVLRNLSETDIMTKLYNRGTGESKTREFISKGQSGLFCMMDIDHFKSINDTFGHAVGDDVIIQFARELRSAFRENDIVFRLGGDEFAVFAPGIQSRRIGMRILKDFVRRVSNLDLPQIEGRKIEASIGALITGNEEDGFEEVYSKADKSVYISKKGNGTAITFCPDEDYMIIKD